MTRIGPAYFSRRQFLGAASSISACAFFSVLPDEEPLLDLHQHLLFFFTKRKPDQLLSHQAQHRVSTTVLLPGEGWMLERLGGNRDCGRFQSGHSDKFVRFACADPAESRAVDVLRRNIERGAIGIGEMKFHVAVDSPEMHRVYELAEEMRVPVLIHFQHEMYNTGIERFEIILKTYPKVNFIGHAHTWWGNIGADLDPQVMYPTGPVKPGGLTDRLLSEYPNLFGDLASGSGLNAITRDPDFSRDFLQRQSRKLIWGSDCACHDGKGGGIQSGRCIAEGSLTALRRFVPEPAILRRILYENGAELLGLIHFHSHTSTAKQEQALTNRL